jgi:signal transduction histidine kinase
MIKDLNEIVQITNNNSEKKVSVDLTKLVNDIFISIGNLIDKNQVRIKPDFSEIDKLYTQRPYIHSIFYNLIINSIKYKRPDVAPLIEIKSRKTAEKIILSFKDNGLGIDLTKDGNKLFGLYKRFHSHVDGKGMGLFMVKTQVELLGGTINITSTLNSGTEFTIEFPLNGKTA